MCGFAPAARAPNYQMKCVSCVSSMPPVVRFIGQNKCFGETGAKFISQWFIKESFMD